MIPPRTSTPGNSAIQPAITRPLCDDTTQWYDISTLHTLAQLRTTVIFEALRLPSSQQPQMRGV